MAVDRYGWVTMPRMVRLTFLNPKPAFLHAVLDDKRQGELALIHPADMKAVCPEYFDTRHPRPELGFHKIRLDRRGRFRVDKLLGAGIRRVTFQGAFNIVYVVTDKALRVQHYEQGPCEVTKYLVF